MYLMGPEPMMSPSTVLLQEEVSFELELIKLHNSTLVSSSKHSLSQYQNYQLNSTQQKPYRKGTQNAMFSYKWNTTNSIRHLNSTTFLSAYYLWRCNANLIGFKLDLQDRKVGR